MSLVLLDRQETKEDFHLQVSLRRSSFGCEAVSNQNTQQALALPEKEVIQPHLPVRLPCYELLRELFPACKIFQTELELTLPLTPNYQSIETNPLYEKWPRY